MQALVMVVLTAYSKFAFNLLLNELSKHRTTCALIITANLCALSAYLFVS
jgi:hypothetical protein